MGGILFLLSDTPRFVRPNEVSDFPGRSEVICNPTSVDWLFIMALAMYKF